MVLVREEIVFAHGSGVGALIKNRSEVLTRLRLILFNTYEITIESVFGL